MSIKIYCVLMAESLKNKIYLNFHIGYYAMQVIGYRL